MSDPGSQDHDLGEAVRLHQAGDLGGAIRLYEKVVRNSPLHAVALNLLGLAFFQASRLEEAATSIKHALSIKGDLPDVDFNLGIILHALGRYEEAAQHLSKAIVAKPNDAAARSTFGAVLKELGREAEAIEQCRQAIIRAPTMTAAYVNLGNALLAVHRSREAIEQYETALRLDPDLADAHICLAGALATRERYDEAIRHYERALALRPDHADSHARLGEALDNRGRRKEAIAHFRRALALDPGHGLAYGQLAYGLLRGADWADFFEMQRGLEARVKENRSQVEPFTMLHYSDDAALHRQCAAQEIRNKKLEGHRPPAARKMSDRGKIRVAYLSSDFRRHAVSFLIAELFELHDRERFEIFGFSTGRDDKSETRARVMKSVDQFHDVRSRGDSEVAAMLAGLEIDILVDLNGHTAKSRLGIAARRPAPVQVSYLGYPGTTGADFFDYIVADKVVLPLDRQPHFSEKIVQLPGCYQVNDRQRRISSHAQSREDAGLPNGFVFCCFNNVDKIAPPVFDVWMRLLKQVEGSVLWLLADESARANLRVEARARGVDPGALAFAERKRPEDHLARYRLADLFLDTLPYNAHTTASDALWAGLPILTCMGSAFAGRVAASLLHAIGLPELVTRDLAEYETLALKLAADRGLLNELRRRLAQNRETHPLFQTDRFCRHLESAYATMVDAARRGEAPRSFIVRSD